MHVIELDHDCLLMGFFSIFSLHLTLLVILQLSLLRMSWYVTDSV